jgi:hypothetical protein
MKVLGTTRLRLTTRRFKESSFQADRLAVCLPKRLEDTVLYYIDIALYSLLVLFMFWDLNRVITVGWQLWLHFNTFWDWICMLIRNYIMF